MSAKIFIPSFAVTVPFFNPLIILPFSRISISVTSKLNCSELSTLKRIRFLNIKKKVRIKFYFSLILLTINVLTRLNINKGVKTATINEILSVLPMTKKKLLI